MSYWKRLLCPAPETKPWPEGLSTVKTTPSSSSLSLRYSAGAAAAAAAGGAFARLPAVVSPRHTSIPRAGGASASSTGTLSLKTRPWSENNSGWAHGPLSVSPPPSPGRSGETDLSTQHHVVTGGYWIGRRKRASLATSERVDARRKRTPSYESLVVDARTNDVARGFDAPVVVDDASVNSSTSAEELPHTISGGRGNTGAARSREAAARAGKSRMKGTLRSGIMSRISLTSQSSTDLERGAIKLATPLVTSLTVPERRRHARRFSESAFSTSSTHEHVVLARSRSLPSIDAAFSPARTLTRDGVVSAPGRGEVGRCCATEQGVHKTAANLMTVPCEQQSGRVGAEKESARTVSGDKGLVPAATEDRSPMAFHNFVFRRHRRDASKHSSSSLSSRESSGTESITCASQGDATGASGARRGLAGGAGGNGSPDVVESLSSRSRREWECAQGRRVRQTGQTRATAGTPSDAFSILSFGGGRKLSCCGGTERVLKCQRCGSARIRLFAPLPAADAATSDKKRHSSGGSVGSMSQSAIVLTRLAMGNTAEFGGNRNWAGTGQVALSARRGASGSRGSGSSNLGGISRESGQTVGSSGGGNWNKGWRFRDECRPGPATPGSTLLVPSRILTAPVTMVS